MNERQLLAFILYKLVKLEGEVRTITEIVSGIESPPDVKSVSNLHSACMEQAFDQYRKDAAAFLEALKPPPEP